MGESIYCKGIRNNCEREHDEICVAKEKKDKGTRKTIKAQQ
jgi:hypothetical protein